MRLAFTAAILPVSPLQPRFGRTSSRFLRRSSTLTEMTLKFSPSRLPTIPLRNTGSSIFIPILCLVPLEGIYRLDKRFASSAWTWETAPLMRPELPYTTHILHPIEEHENDTSTIDINVCGGSAAMPSFTGRSISAIDKILSTEICNERSCPNRRDDG